MNGITFNEKAGPPVVEQKPVHAMNDRELAEMLNRARKLGYNVDTLNFLTGWIAGKFKAEHRATFNEAEFLFWSGHDKELKQ